MEEKVLYFGYGANKTPEMMAAITGNENIVGKPAVLEGFGLYVQRLNQIPNIVAPNAPAPLSPREILQSGWGENFESYVIKPNPDTKVHGTLWKLTPVEHELVRNWELIDFGWYRDAAVDIQTEDGNTIKVQTEIVDPEQEVEREVDGHEYSPFLMDLADFRRIAKETREEHLSMMPEGNPTSKETLA